MTISAKILADSISPSGQRVTTLELRYPRFIHAEFMTHRVFSRNASSSRAIPVERMIADLRRDPAMPVSWGRNQRGMQAGDNLTEQEIATCKSIWLNSMENAIHSATQLIELGLHKQVANRILEPWAHINVVVTATGWDNFFELRIHPDAQPEMRVLAETIHSAMDNSVPIDLQPGEWHLPYINAQDWSAARHYKKAYRITRDEPMYDELVSLLIQVSAARCARVSYLTHDGRQTTIEEDLALYERLVGSTPLHASPVEHQCTPDTTYPNPHEDPIIGYENPDLHNNFTGWIQYRKVLEHEYANE